MTTSCSLWKEIEVKKQVLGQYLDGNIQLEFNFNLPIQLEMKMLLILI